jgi:pSer/pThr/pTyr-binding forkhead associated (FHA) protein
VVERGTYQDLKQLGGIFAKMLAEQNRYSAEKAGNKSIVRSAFIEVPGDREWGAPGPAVRGVPWSQPVWQQQPQTLQPPQPQVPLKEARVLIECDGRIVGERRLDKPLLTVGRQSGNDICIPNQRVSRLHARIRYEHNAWFIEDAESVNGLVYQGKRVERLVLANGDRVYLGPEGVLHYLAR